MSNEGLERYEKGGYWRVDDLDGSRVRARDTKQQWDGAIVTKDAWSPRHPQEFLRSKRDDQGVPKPRPVPPIIDGGPPTTFTTADAAAAATSIEVVSTTEFFVGAYITIMLDSTDAFLTMITSIDDYRLAAQSGAEIVTLSGSHILVQAPGAEIINFTPPLPTPASSGVEVVVYIAPVVRL